MTPAEMVKEAKIVRVTFGVADVNVTKKEALRLIEEHRLPANDCHHAVGCVDLFRDLAVITFHT